MNIASGLGSATTLIREDADALRGDSRHRSHRRRRAHAHLGQRAASPRLHASARHRTGARRDLRLADRRRAGVCGRGRGASGAPVALVGRTAGEELFGAGFNPVGETVTIDEARVRRSSGMIDATDPDQNETVFVPVTTLQQHPRHAPPANDRSFDRTGRRSDARRGRHHAHPARAAHARPERRRARARSAAIRMPGDDVRPRRTISP